MEDRTLFLLILVLIFEVLRGEATEEILHVEKEHEDRQFVPGRQDILMHQQTEAIRRIVHAKSLELQKPFDIDDSLLLTRCQQIANQQRSNGRLQAEALTNEEFETTSIKVEDSTSTNPKTTEVTTKTTEEKTEKVNGTKEDQEPQSTDVKVDNQVPPPQSIYQGPPLYYIYPQYIQNVNPETPVPQEPSSTSTSTTTTTTTTTQTPSPPLYTEKLRFVLRLPYPKPDKLSGYPYEFDRYAYFPKELQPEYVNMPVPYSPTWHMIRRLVIPSKVPASYIVETNS